MKSRAQRIKINDLKTGDTISLNKFKINSKKEFEAEHILISKVISGKILTKTQTEKIIESGLLEKVIYKNKQYFVVSELQKYLKEDYENNK